MMFFLLNGSLVEPLYLNKFWFCINFSFEVSGSPLYYTLLYHTILYYTILYYTILYYAILFSTLYSYTHAHMHSSKFKGASLRVCKEFLLNAPMKGEVKYRKWSSNLRVLFTFPVYQLACFGVHPLLYFLYQPLVIGQFWHLRVSVFTSQRSVCVSWYQTRIRTFTACLFKLENNSP